MEQVAFSFDRETLSEQQARDLERKSNGRLLLLPRRCLECYFIDPSAISQLIEACAPNLAATATPELVEKKLKELGPTKEFGASHLWTGDLNSPDWLAAVDGAQLIGRTLSDITEAKLRFDKVRHTIMLARCMVRNDPGRLTELRDYLKSLMNMVMVAVRA